jgi:hypothetical protein
LHRFARLCTFCNIRLASYKRQSTVRLAIDNPLCVLQSQSPMLQRFCDQ